MLERLLWKSTNCLMLQVILDAITASLHHRCNVVPQSKPVKLIVVEGGIRLRNNTIEVIALAPEVHQDLQGHAIVS
jgi:hypothetical protein